MNTTQEPVLDPLDRTLLAKFITSDFNVHALIDPASPHSAQHNILDLLSWLAAPHIQVATEFYIAAMHHAACCAHALDISRQIATLKHLLFSTLSLIKNAPPLPSDPEQSQKAIRELRASIRESRLVFSALKSLTRAPRAPKGVTRSASASSASDSASARRAGASASSHHTHPAKPATPHQPSPDLAASLHSELQLLRADIAALDLSSPDTDPLSLQEPVPDHPQHAQLQVA
jgi:hypothetical protein